MDSLVYRIYDCVLQPTLWREVLQEIAQNAGAFGAMIFDCENVGATDRVVIRHLSDVYDPGVVSEYIGKFNAFELRDQARFAALSSTANEVNLIRCDDLTTSRTALESQANVQAMMQMGVYFRAGALLSKNTVALDRFALQFRRSQGAISEEKRILVQSLLPHVSKALSMGRSVVNSEVQNVGLVTIFNQLATGIAILRSNGDLVYANTAFRSISEKYLLISRPSAQKLAVDRLPAHLQSLFQSADSHGKFGARPVREGAFLHGNGDQMGLFVEVSPIADHPEFEKFGDGFFVVSLLDSASVNDVDMSVLRQYFPMTDAEFAILDLVIKGHTNAEIAEHRSRSVETVNSQIKAILLKSSTRNRTELVRMAVSLAASRLK